MTARPLSLAHLTVLEADPLELIEAGIAGGYDAVGLRIVPPLPGDRIVDVVGNTALQREFSVRLAGSGLKLLDVEAIWLSEVTDVEALLPVLDVGAQLGARHVLVTGNDPDAGRLAETFARLCAAAHERGLRVMLEFIPYAAGVKTLANAHTLIREIRPADAGILVDALHLSRSGGHPEDLAHYDQALFSYFHLCDAHAGPASDLRHEGRTGRLYPGEGGLWLSEFLQAFPRSTPAAVEAPSAADAGVPVLQRARRAAEACRRLFNQRGLMA